MNIIKVYKLFPTKKICIKHLEQTRWPNGPVCPYCACQNNYKLKGEDRYHCLSCRTSFSVLVGTIFQGTKTDLQKWFVAISMMLNAKRGIAARQLARDIDVNKNTAWSMAMRIRSAMQQGDVMLSGVVQCDEAAIGGKNANKHHNKKIKNCQGRSFKGKLVVLGVRNRKGAIVTQMAPSTNTSDIHPFLFKNVEKGAILHTDEWKGYRGLNDHYTRVMCNHEHKEFVSEAGATTNSMENFWSIVKRGVIGNYYHISKKYAQSYMDEFTFKQNQKENKDLFNYTIKKMLYA
jgi:transposase-like protein